MLLIVSRNYYSVIIFIEVPKTVLKKLVHKMKKKKKKKAGAQNEGTTSQDGIVTWFQISLIIKQRGDDP